MQERLRVCEDAATHEPGDVYCQVPSRRRKSPVWSQWRLQLTHVLLFLLFQLTAVQLGVPAPTTAARRDVEVAARRQSRVLQRHHDGLM